MKEKFEKILQNINKELIFLSNEVEHSLRQSMIALDKGDVKLAEDIIQWDKDIDQQEIQIEDKILGLLALQQPVAIDLRFIIGGLKMNNDLERIGDHAVNIARTAIQLSAQPKLETRADLLTMSDLACKMLHQSVHAFIHQDADLARKVCSLDNEVDDYYDLIVDKTIKLLETNTDMLKQGFAIVRVARSLERVGDLSTNISEDVVFMKEAKIIRHQFEE